MHRITQEDLILYLYKEIPAEQSTVLIDALASDWALREKYEVFAAAVNDLENISLSPRKAAVEAVLQYAACSVDKLPNSV